MNAPLRQVARVPVTKEGFERLKRGHPWLLSGHLDKSFVGPAEACVIFLGEHPFFYSPKSDIRLRRLGPSQRHWIDAFKDPIVSLEAFEATFGAKIQLLLRNAFTLRTQHLKNETCFRWIFSEADFIPGLVLDRYGTKIVAQIQSAPIEKFWSVLSKIILSVFTELTGAQGTIIEIRKSASRKKEGLELEETQTVEGDWYQWNGLEWWLSPGSAQKTGSYLDQRSNHLKAQAYAKALGLKSAWDLCSFEGGFGLHLAKAGLEVLAVDQSESALQVAQKNAVRNGISPELYKTQNSDVFTFLRTAFDSKSRVPMIVLDPPSFVKSRAEKEGAMRGFRELNLRALHCLESGGLLVSCVCSHHISSSDYETLVIQSAHDARRSVRILEVAGPSADHAPLLGFKESSYLQAWFLEVR